MANTVGELEFIVNADTGRLVAQLTKGGDKAGTAGGKATVRAYNEEIEELGGRKLVQALAEVRAKIDASLKNITAQIGIDDTKAKAEAKALQKNLDAMEAAIDLGLKDEDVKAEARVLRLELAELLDSIPVGGALDEDEFLAVGKRAELLIGEITAKIKPQLDDLAVRAEAKLAAEEIEATFAAAKAEIDITYDERAWQRRQAKIKSDNEKFGEESGVSWGKGFNAGSTSRLTKIFVAVGVVAESALVGLDALVSQAIAAISSAVVAAGAGISAVAAQAAGFGNVLAGSITAFAGFGTALGEVNDEFARTAELGLDFQDSQAKLAGLFKELTPAAQDAAFAFAEVRGELAASQALIQEQFFSGMGDEIIALTNQVLPNLTRALQLGAESANIFAKDLAGIAKQTDFEDLVRGLKPAIDGAFRAAGNLAEALGPFLEAAAPAAEMLSDALEGASEYLLDFLSTNTDEVSDFLVRGIESLIRWGDLLTSLGHLLGTVFAAGTAAGDTMVEKLDALIQKFDAWLQTPEGNTALVDWFQAGEDAMVAFLPVLQGLQEALSILLTADSAQNFEELAEAIGAALPAVAELLRILGEAGLLTTLLNVAAALEPMLRLIGDLPDPILQWAGAMALILPLMIKLKAAMVALGVIGPGLIATIKNLGIALKLLVLQNPLLLGLAAALAALVVVYAALGRSNNEADKRTKELTTSLKAQVDALIAVDGAALGAAGGISALNRTLTEGEGDGEEFTKALGNLGLTTDDAATSLLKLQSAGKIDFLSDVATDAAQAQLGLELTSDQAARLAGIVDSTDDNFDRYNEKIARMAEETGIATTDLYFLAANMEELQDQAQKTNLDDLVKGFFEGQRAISSLDESVRDAIPNIVQLDSMSPDELVAAFNEYINTADGVALATEEAEAAAAAIEAELATLGDTTTDVTQTLEEWMAAVTESGQEMRRSAVEAQRLADVTKDVARGQALAAGVADPRKWTDLGDAFFQASKDANSLNTAIDILFGASLGVDAATDSMIVSVSQLSGAIQEADEYTDGWSGTLDGFNEDSLLLREGLRGGVESIQAYAVAALEAGVSTGEVTGMTEMFRQQLIDTATELTGNREKAEDYINELLGTPEELATLIEQPGMIEALLDAGNLELLYDDFGNPIITPFLDDGLKDTLTDAEELQGVNKELNKSVTRPSFRPDSLSDVKVDVTGLQDDLEIADGTVVDPDIPMTGWPGASTDIEGVQKQADTLADTVVDIEVDVPGFAGVTGKLTDMTADATELGDVDPEISISTPGADASISKITTLKQKIDSLYSKTITITTNQRTNTVGSMTGRLVTGPMNTDVGERGLAEAIIPLQLPLNRVNPEVRPMAELLRGKGPKEQVAAGPSRVITNNFTINETDRAESTAQRVVNRVAASLN